LDFRVVQGYKCWYPQKARAKKVPDVYRGQDFRKKNVLRLEKKNDGMMDDKSGDE